jgi:hypothetical protein
MNHPGQNAPGFLVFFRGLMNFNLQESSGFKTAGNQQIDASAGNVLNSAGPALVILTHHGLAGRRQIARVADKNPPFFDGRRQRLRGVISLSGNRHWHFPILTGESLGSCKFRSWPKPCQMRHCSPLPNAIGRLLICLFVFPDFLPSSFSILLHSAKQLRKNKNPAGGTGGDFLEGRTTSIGKAGGIATPAPLLLTYLQQGLSQQELSQQE